MSSEGASASSPAQTNGGEGVRLSNIQRVSQKKQLVKSYPRNKKLEKLAVYSSCKVRHNGLSNNRNIDKINM